MGQAIIKPGGKKNNSFSIPPLLDETHIFAAWSIDDVRELWNRLRKQVSGFALVEAEFEGIMSFKKNMEEIVTLEELFDILDNDNDGRIDGLELLGGLALVCQGSFEEKSRFAFELYDFNLNSTISKKEMTMMMMASICGMNILTGGNDDAEPTLDVFESLAEDAFLRADKDGSGQISFDEFIMWARSNRDLMAGLESLNKVAIDARNYIESEDSAGSADEGVLSDAEKPLDHGVVHSSSRERFIAQGDRNFISARKKMIEDLGEVITEIDTDKVTQWLGQLYEPLNHKLSKRIHNGPDSNLTLNWAFGYRAQTKRNNLRYICSEIDPNEPEYVVYPTAALGVVYNLSTRTQSFYQGHDVEVTCMSLHPSGRLIATGDVCSNIHMWNTTTCECVGVLKGIAKEGIMHLHFSPNGDRIATVGLDSDHTVAIYDCSTGEIISSSKGLSSPNNVHGISYSTNGTEIVLVGNKTIKFYSGVHTQSRTITSHFAKIGRKGKKQTFFCASYMENDAIIGCASGELYRFRGIQCIQIVQAHCMNDPVLCINYNAREGVLVTGGKDSLVKTWDSSLIEVGNFLDISEGNNGSTGQSLCSTVTSVHLLRKRILIGTKGSDIFDCVMPDAQVESHSLNRIAFGHSGGEIKGLATHPRKDEFITSGTDKTIRIWSIRSKEQINIRVLPSSAHVLAYNYTASIIALGMDDGSTALMEAESTNLRVYSTWKHSTESATVIKFSPDDVYLAVGSADWNIYLYISNDGRKYSRHSVCRGHTNSVIHLDFSVNSLNIQSNDRSNGLMFWDTRGNHLDANELRDTKWATVTCTFGWSVQGIWPEITDYSDINTCVAEPDVGVIITGDDNRCLKVYRYPSIKQGALHQAYSGHGSSVECVRFSYNRRYVVSIGSEDQAILLWKHEIEKIESSDDEKEEFHSDSSQVSSTYDNDLDEIEYQLLADYEVRSLLQEAINRNQSTEEISQLINHFRQNGSNDTSYQYGNSWKSSSVEPTKWLRNAGSTDCDLVLEWVHGFSSSLRNNVRYSAAGEIIFTAASVAAIYSKALGKQKFLQGAHKDDILALAAHPSGQLFATGEVGRRPNITIWSSKDVRIMQRIENIHRRGVSLLAFSSGGGLLASIGMDGDSKLAIHDWVKGVKLMCTSTIKGRILCMCFLYRDLLNSENGETDIVITGSEKHLYFWWSSGLNVNCQKALWGKERKDTINCVSSGSPAVCVTGSTRGSLVIWKDFKAVSNAKNDYGDLMGELGSYPHKSSINTIWAIPGSIDLFDNANDLLESRTTSNRYLTGDRLGVIAIWRMIVHCGLNKNSQQVNELRLKCIAVFNTNNFSPRSMNGSVRSLCERDENILIGTLGCEIYELSDDSIEWFQYGKKLALTGTTTTDVNPELTTSKKYDYNQIIKADKLISGHHTGELWGLTNHPNFPVYITAGDDKTIRCWNLEDHKILSFFKLTEKCRAVDIIPTNGQDLAISLISGVIWIIKMDQLINPSNKTMTHVDTELNGKDITNNICGKDENGSDVKNYTVLEQTATQWVQILKYSFDGSILAAGSYDRNIYLYSIKDGIYTFFKKCESHNSYLTHIDFGVLLYCSSTNGEDIFEKYDENTKKIIKTTTKKDYNKIDLVTVESRDIIPTDICFQSTCGGNELLFWNIDGSRLTSATTIKDSWWATWTCPFGWPVQGIYSPTKDGTEYNAVTRSHSWDRVPVMATADEFGRVKLFNYPCVIPGAPDKCYKGHSRHVTNISFSHDDAYFVSIGGIDRCVFVWNTDVLVELRERLVSKVLLIDDIQPECAEDDSEYNTIKKMTNSDFRISTDAQQWREQVRVPTDWSCHDEELTTRTVPTLELKFAYGYRGWDCRNNVGFADSSFEIAYHVAAVGIVYNSETHTQVHNTEHTNDIISLSIHPEGHTVATGEIGDSPKIVLWDANTGVTIRTLLFHKYGVSHIKFSDSGLLIISLGMDDDCSLAVHNSRTGALVGQGKVGRGVNIYSISSYGDFGFVTGGKNHVKIWEFPNSTSAGGELSSKTGIYNKSVKIRTVISTAYLGADPVTGMIDGQILLWKERNNTKSIQGHSSAVTSMCTLSGEESGPRIISGGKDGFVNVWNIQLAKVWSLNLNESTPVSICSQIQALSYKEGKILMGTKGGEIYEVNMLNTSETFQWVSGHYEHLSEVRGLATHPTASKFITAGDDSTIRLWDSRTRRQMSVVSMGEKVRAISYHPAGDQIAAGLCSGHVRFLTANLQTQIAEISVTPSQINVLMYSPNGMYLAVGSNDYSIYIIETKTLICKAQCKGHLSYIVSIDFSENNQYLQSSSGNYELLFWKIDGKSVSPTEVRDEKWNSHTNTFGWPTKGLHDFSETINKPELLSVRRSPNDKFMASGDNHGNIQLIPYPYPTASTVKNKVYHAHAHEIFDIDFSFDGKYLYTVGGLDKSILQWECKSLNINNSDYINKCI
jgi:microtubule-associated protein-like 6